MGHFNDRPEFAAMWSALDSRVSKLEAVNRVIPVQSGPPPANQQDGSISGDKAGSFFYIVLGGVAKKVAVA